MFETDNGSEGDQLIHSATRKPQGIHLPKNEMDGRYIRLCSHDGLDYPRVRSPRVLKSDWQSGEITINPLSWSTRIYHS